MVYKLNRVDVKKELYSTDKKEIMKLMLMENDVSCQLGMPLRRSS